MKAEQVEQALRKKFFDEQQRLVFWHDRDAEFSDYVSEALPAELNGVEVLRVAEFGALAAKLHLERKDRQGKYLVYNSGEVPKPEADWLLDIRLYSGEFHADMASLWLQELGLVGLYLRDHLRIREKFLSSQERREKLKKLISPDDDQHQLDLKMISVLAGSPIATAFQILRAVCHGHVRDECFDMQQAPKAMQVLEKMGLADKFWEVMQVEFGYQTQTPSIAGLVRSLFLTELSQQLGSTELSSHAQYLLPESGARNAVVCLTQWRDSSSKGLSYDYAAAALAEEQNIGALLERFDLSAVQAVYTFWEAERVVVRALRDRLLDSAPGDHADATKELIAARQAGHWLAGAGRDAAERKAMAQAYEAIQAAAELMELRSTFSNGFRFDAPSALLAAYQQQLFQFDRFYRAFCTNAKAVLGQGWDLLKPLSVEVERVYDQGFLQPLGLEWSRLLDAGFLGQWALPQFPAQQTFYRRVIQPYLAKSSRKRAFVVISDAFRYEAAWELTRELNNRYRMHAELTPMLGVLPSYTTLGMASLLPHQSLTYAETGDVFVDGRSAAGTAARNKQLQTVGGMACQASELVAMTKAKVREFTEGKQVVYVYHNVIDARGDSASTEDETFDAVKDCIEELGGLVKKLINDLNASKVWVTADHGFLFQETSPRESDRSRLQDKPSHAVKVKKRYVIGRALGETPEAHHGNIDVTAGAEGSMEFWVPRSVNRFHFTGGARFVHGGAMPQEALVPLVTVEQVRGGQKAATRSEKVAVQVLGTGHKITTPKYRFELIQTEAVGERRKPITLRVGVYEQNQPVSSIEVVSFDSASDNMNERQKSVLIELQGGTFDKQKEYRLVLRDSDSDAEVQAIPVIIDRSFDDDF